MPKPLSFAFISYAELMIPLQTLSPVECLMIQSLKSYPFKVEEKGGHFLLTPKFSLSDNSKLAWLKLILELQFREEKETTYIDVTCKMRKIEFAVYLVANP
jgi:hypothetical protein